MKLLKPGALLKRIKIKLAPVSLPITGINEVWGHYDLGSLEKVRVPNVGKRSRTVLIKSRERDFALKAYTPYLGEAEILFEHSIAQFLCLMNYPTPGLIENRLGQTITLVGNQYYACYEFVEGQVYSNYFLSYGTSKQVLTQAARTLARYHRLIAGFVPKGCKAEGFQSGTYRRKHGKDWYLDELAKAYTFLFYNEQLKKKTPTVMDQWPAIRDEFRALHDKLEGDQPPPLPILAIHGDFGLHNLLFHQDRLTAVLDFECTHLDWRLTDVLSSIVRFSRTRQGGLNQSIATTFLDAYQAIWPLEPAEVEAAVPVFRLARYHNAIKSLAKGHITGKKSFLEAAESSFSQILSPNRVTIADMLGKIIKT